MSTSAVTRITATTDILLTAAMVCLFQKAATTTWCNASFCQKNGCRALCLNLMAQMLCLDSVKLSQSDTNLISREILTVHTP